MRYSPNQSGSFLSALDASIKPKAALDLSQGSRTLSEFIPSDSLSPTPGLKDQSQKRKSRNPTRPSSFVNEIRESSSRNRNDTSPTNSTSLANPVKRKTTNLVEKRSPQRSPNSNSKRDLKKSQNQALTYHSPDFGLQLTSTNQAPEDVSRKEMDLNQSQVSSANQMNQSLRRHQDNFSSENRTT